jgi:hypothetical protein
VWNFYLNGVIIAETVRLSQLLEYEPTDFIGQERNMQSSPGNTTSVQVIIRANQTDPPNVSEVGLFVFDFDSLYELARLSVDPKYADFNFTRFALYRNARRVDSRDKMYVDLLKLASPLEMASAIAVYAGAAASISATLWVLVQAFERIYNLKLNREKLQLEIQKLKRDLDPDANDFIEPDPVEVMDQLEERGAREYIEMVEKRLFRSSIQIEEVIVEVAMEEIQ